MHAALAVLTALLLCPMAFAAPLVARATRAAASPAIDGKLVDPAWQNAPELTGFVLAGTKRPALQQTSVRVLFDEEALYFGFTCLEDRLGGAVDAVKERDGDVFAGDCVEIFLGPTHDRFNFLHFAVGHSGARYDASGDGAGVASNWDAPWQAAVGGAKDRWLAEVRVPFACLQLSDKVGSTWDLNLCRRERPHGEVSSWSPAGERFAAPQTFGTLTDLDVDLSPYHVAFGPVGELAAAFGSNAADILVANGGKAARKLGLELTVHPPSEKPRTSRDSIAELAPGQRAQLALPYQVFEPGRHRLVVTATDQDSGRQVAAFERNFDLATLVEHSLFHSYYRNDVTVRSRFNVAEDDLGACRLVATLTPAQSEEVLAQQELQPRQRDASLTLPLAGREPARYAVRVRLERDGKVEHEQVLPFALLRDRPVASLRVHPRDDLTLVVDGKPFFPLGIYEAPVTQKMIDEFKAAGFNTVKTYGSTAVRTVLDHLEAAQLKAWVVLSHSLDLSTQTEKRRDTLAEIVQSIGKHPAVLVWESIDEPAWGSQNAEGLLQGYEFLRKLDPEHPVWTNHAPRNHVATLAYFNRATDIGGCDIYPVPEPQSQSNLPNKTLSVVADETDKNCAAVNDEKPIFMVLQGFAWKALSKRDDPEAVYPNLPQQRYMAYSALVHGARGILYWGTHYTPKPSQAWADVKTIVHELSRLEPMLVAPKPDTEPTVASDTGSVEAILRQAGGQTYLVCVNNENRNAVATVSGLPAGLRSLRVLYEEDRRLGVRGGVAQVLLPGYGVVVATTDDALDDTRPDYSAELESPAAALNLEQMREPGNAVLNPSFEFDPAATDLPAQWNCRYPFSAVLDGDNPHSGQRCLKITSPEEDFLPLLVQQNLDVEPNREYELSGWLRTDGGDITGRVYAEWSLAGKYHTYVSNWTRGTTDWQRIQRRFTTTPAPGGRLYVVVQTRGKGTAWFDDVKLTRVEE